MNARKALGTALLALSTLFAGVAQSAFDPVHEDIDLFMVNPAVSSQRPNVLILLDNTANWNQAFANEKSALVSLVNGLNAQFNVGLGMYVETGAGNDNQDGAYIRFAVRQMTGTSQTTLATMVDNLSQLGDKGNNNTIGLAMSEVYKYFAGSTSYSSYGKAKTDYAGNASNSAGGLAGNALPANPGSTSLFNSPATSNCQKNFVIYIGNGKFNENASAVNTAQSRLQSALGSSPSTIAISPNGQQGNWADEWTRFMAKTGFTKTINGETKRLFVNTYAVAIDPGQQNLWGTGSTAGTNDSLRLMKSMAENGNGKYFEVTSGNGGSEIVEALTQIFNEIQSVNSVFASTTLPVSVNVRGTNLNQVYIGMFRPDAQKSPRWFGNLKMYKLAADSTRTLYLSDSNGARVEDPNTGFVGASNRSFWTHNSSFWGYRDASQNGVGGASDAPDGDLVEKGAVAQRLRESYAAAQTSRNVYTCTAGSTVCTPCTLGGSGSSKTCSGGSILSDTPFATSNDGITAISLGLGTRDVSSLSGKVTRTVTALADRRNVAISNSASASVGVSAISNGGSLLALSSLTAFDTTKTRAISSLSGATVSSAYGVTEAAVSGTEVTVKIDKGSLTSNPCGSATTLTISGNNRIPDGTYAVTSTSASTRTSGRSTIQTYTISFNANVPGAPNSAGTLTCSTNSTVATATVATLPAGLAVGSRINVSGASPAGFNGDFQVTSVGANTFSYSLGLNNSQGVATTPGTVKVYNTVNSSGAYSAAATTVRITGTTAAAHTLAAGNTVAITAAAPATSNGLSFYNGTRTIKTAATPSFTYDVDFSGASPQYPPVDATAPGAAYKTGVGGAGTTVTITSTAAHGLADGANADITGIDSCFNASSTVISNVSTNSFSYQTGTTCAPLAAGADLSGARVAGSSYGTTVTATLASHGFQVGDNIVVADGTIAAHNGTFVVASVPNASSFTYSNGAVGGTGPSGQYTVRLASNPKVYATSAGHGFSTNDAITIAGAAPAGYNGTYTITVIDADTFTYPVAAAPGANTGQSVTAAKNTATAYAYVANHGFSSGTVVSISGATPAAFNGNFTIAATGPNSFTYALPSAQGDATGTILAAAGGGTNSERDQIIDWVRGQDNAEDENQDTSNTDCRASVHGDVLHSRPAVINYNRFNGDNDVYIFYGSNDGVFRAVKGGSTTDAGDDSNLLPGAEAWGFVPTDSFTGLKRLRNNTPAIGSSFKKPYFMDGPIGVYTVDANDNGKLLSTDAGDKVYLYIGARRGGRFLYSLDVTNPLVPKYRWKFDNTTTGFSELGYTWSQPTVVTGINNYTNPVLIFGGGYDPNVEDVENCTIQSATSAAVRYYSGAISYTSTGCTKSDGSAIAGGDAPNATVSRTMGRAIYMVDGITGQLIWWAGRTGSGADLEVAGLDFAIAADPIVIRNESGGPTNRAYFADTGGNVWRFDFGNSDRTRWTVTKIASLGDLASASQRRKFLYPPDAVAMNGYTAVLLGSGDREHPFDMTVTNRFYMLKDRGTDAGPLTGVDNSLESVNPTITESRLYNATSTAQTTASSTATSDEKAAATTAAKTALRTTDGWYVTFEAGEKDIGNAVALNGVVFFNTNVSPLSPSATSSDTCQSNLGIAHPYQVGIEDISTEKKTHTGGGYLPSPVHVVVQVDVPVTIDGVQTTQRQIVEGVISGTEVSQPEGITLGNRSRRYWYKEID